MMTRHLWAGRLVLTFACGVLLSGVQLLTAATLTLTPAADTGIREFSPTTAYGDNQVVIAGTTGPLSNSGQNRGLFRFDLSSIPSQATITDVRLTFGVVRVPPIQVDADFGLYPILQSWAEGSATWNIPGAGWHGPGGVAGQDYAQLSSATTAIDPIVGSYTFESTAGLVGDVQAWVNTPTANFGWMLLAEQETTDFTARQFSSKESGAGASLLITYVVPEPSTLGLLLAGIAVIGFHRSRANSKKS